MSSSNKPTFAGIASQPTIIFISADVKDHEKLFNTLSSHTETYLLNTEQDGIYQIAAILQGRSGLNSIHILTHGNSGSLSFGSSYLNSDNLSNYIEALSQIGASLAKNADILLYGCNVAQGEQGFQFIDNLATYTQANIAASSTLTGAEALGGNWLLDVMNTGGKVNTTTLNIPEYEGVLIDININKSDYAPGETAFITADDLLQGSTVKFQVQHILDPGYDSIWGTFDDTLGNNTGEGHEAWYITDGGEGDLDGVANGSIQTTWYVNPDDSLGETFLASAQQVEAGSDNEFATADDVQIGETATTTFTDSSGSYTIKWYGADPIENNGSVIPTYEKLTPSEYLSKYGSYPVGNAIDPLPNAEAYSTTGVRDAVTSLAPKHLALGQIVPFFIEITVKGDVTPEDGIITITPEWLTKTTSGDNFGFDPSYGVLAAFVDKGDGLYTDTGTVASVTGFSTSILGTGTNNERIHSDITVSGLNDGDKVIVEVWVVLKDSIPLGTSGNVQSSLYGATTSTGDTINTGNQTVPLLKAQEFFTSKADLSVIKSDSLDASSGNNLTTNADVDPSNLKPGDTFTYTILAKNNSADTVANGVIVTDTLDPNVTFISALDVTPDISESEREIGTFTDGTLADTVTWNIGSLSPGEYRLFTVTVKINDNAPTGSVTQDLLNKVSITSLTQDPDLSNNTDDEPTNVVNPVLVIDKALFANADGDGSKDVSAGDVLTYSFLVSNTGTANLTDVVVKDPLTGLDKTIDFLAAGNSITLSDDYTVTAADVAAGTIVNTATADSDQTGETSDTETVPVPMPNYTISKTVNSIINPDGTNGGVSVDQIGDIINYSIVVKNIGTANLTGVVIKDQVESYAEHILTLDSGDTNHNGILDSATSFNPAEVWTYKVSYTVIEQDFIDNNKLTYGDGTIDNTVTAITTQIPVPKTDVADVPIASDAAQIAPTGTTPQQYIDGTAQDFSDYYAYQGGVIQYTMNAKTGAIASTNPGVFFYYTGLSNTIKGFDGPDAGTAPDQMKVFIDQSDDSATLGAFSATKNDVKLYKVTDLDHNGIDAGDTYTQVQLKSGDITLGTGSNAGDVIINFTPDAVGSLYIVSVKYDTTSVTGTKLSSPLPTAYYSFTTDVGKDGTIEETDTAGITLEPKFSRLMLDGEVQENHDVPVLDKADLQEVIDDAIDFWAQHGADALDLSILRRTDVSIADLGGNQLGLTDAINSVTIDDDAAGYGWWTNAQAEVNPQMVDLLSVVVHEFGHVLGHEHNEMDAMLAVGERDLPEINLIGVQQHPVDFA